MIVDERVIEDVYCLCISDTGQTHLCHNLVNQDAFGFFVAGDFSVLVISDGVGSCKYAELGSNAVVKACEKVVQDLVDDKIFFTEDIVKKLFVDYWFKFIPYEESFDYCATLKAVFFHGSEILMLSVGDGFEAILLDDVFYISPREEMCFANETNCLSPQILSTGIWSYLIERPKENYRCTVFMCTDGVANGVVDGKERELVEEIASMNNSSLSNNIKEFIAEISQYSFDDKTIGVYKC